MAESQADSRRQRAAAILAELQHHGHRATIGGLILAEALVEANDRHESLTAEEAAAAVHRSNPLVHPSTIYRLLDRLEKVGLVEHVHLGHGRAVYHLTDEPHVHLVCEQCGAETRAGRATLAIIHDELLAAAGFHSSPHHFAIPGLCTPCAAQSATEPSIPEPVPGNG